MFKTKDILLSLAVGYIVTTLSIWEVRENMWLIFLMASALCWYIMKSIEIRYEKWKSARGAATPGRAHRKLFTTKL